MLHLASTRSTLRASAIVAAAVLAACGSSRKVSESGDVCVRCHGDAARSAPASITDADAIRLLRAAPPKSVNGETAYNAVSVGAHQAHLVAGRLRGPMACSECHVVPADMIEHEAGIARIAAGTAEPVAFGPLASQDAVAPAFDDNTTRCNGTYCHGSTLNRGGSNHSPLWTGGVSQATCASCHAFPPATHAPGSFNCNGCHAATVEADNWTIVFAADGTSKHVNGHLDVSGLTCSGGCTTCHGAPTGATTLSGAHLAHVTSVATDYGRDTKTADTLTTAATTYDFGCGNCHSTDCDDHASGLVVLSPLNATVGSLKARNALTASYDAANKTCSGVYCHSSGQASPTYVATPAWNATVSLGCGDCHSNPPDYANGGTAAATANSHIGLLTESDGLTYESGHFGGLPAMMHDWSRHGRGDWDSAPITCQTCHYDTADSTHTGPSGFYYLDTTGNYDLGGTGRCFGGTGPTCTGGTILPAAGYACTNCHTGTPPQQGGRARPYYHVNGTRDVAFDRRATVSGEKIPFNVALTPTRPYWLTAPSTFTAIDTTGHVDGTAVAGTTTWTTISVSLVSAQWNAAAKTCSSVDCHFNRTSVRWGEPLSTDPTTGNCVICHNF